MTVSEGILFFGKARSKELLLDLVQRGQRPNTELWSVVTACELIWSKQLLEELKLCKFKSMDLICDNQTDLNITFNPVFHEIDCFREHCYILCELQ